MLNFWRGVYFREALKDLPQEAIGPLLLEGGPYKYFKEI